MRDAAAQLPPASAGRMTMLFAARRRERAELASAIADPETPSIFVQGPSGAGKTALIETVLGDCARTGSIVGTGRYSDGDMARGLAPVLDALARATEKALDQLYEPVSGAQSLSAMLGGRLALLFEAGFRPRGIMPAHTTAGDGPLANRDSAARLIDAVLRILRWLDGFGAPLVLFVDDWHRAPPDAQACVIAMQREAAGHLCTILLAGRDDDPSARNSTRSFGKVMRLGPLARDEQLELLAAATGDQACAAAIVDWLGDGASGLPLDLLEGARALTERSALLHDGRHWAIDERIALANDRMDFAKTVVERARRLAPEDFEIAVAIAIWSDPVSIEVLARLMATPADSMKSATNRLIGAGLLRPSMDALAIRHDRIRAALLGATELGTVRELAARMSSRAASFESDDWAKVERTALRLRLAAGLEGTDPRIWRDRFARASVKGRRAADFAAAADFAEAAWQLRSRSRPEDPALDRVIVREALMSAANRRDVAATGERGELLIATATTEKDFCEAHEWTSMALRLAGDSEAAWQGCTRALARFGIRIPEKVGKLDLLRAIAAWRLAALGSRRRAATSEEAEQAFARFGQTAATIAWERSPDAAALISIGGAARARRLGQKSAFWITNDAFISASIGDYARASALGAEAIRLLSHAVRPGLSLYTALFFGRIWTEPLATLHSRIGEVYELSLGEGDLVGAAYAVRMDAIIAWRTGKTLAEIMDRLKACDLRAEQLGDTTTRAEITRIIALARRMVEPDDPSTAIPPAFLTREYSDLPVVVLEYLSFARDWAGVLRIAEAMKEYRSELDSHPGSVIWRFHENLARLKQGLPPHGRDMRFIARAARLNPADHRAKLMMLEAEGLRRRRRASCRHAHAAAVEAALVGSSRLEAGLAAECAASAALSFGDVASANHFNSVARRIWSEWGARSKLSNEPVEAAAQGEERRRLLAAESRAAMSERAERAKSRFLAEVGHELRTPLQGMQSLLDLASEAPESADLGEIREVFGSLKSVVDDLTELGALGSDAPLNLRRTDLCALVKSEAAVAKAMAAAGTITLTSEVDIAANTAFEIDSARVRQVVRNLLSNAVKYAGDGEITLRLRADRGADDRATVEIVVEDSGPGIREADLPRLFEPFERGGRDDGKGLGLGLSVAKKIADRMKGTLIVSNRAEGGARFVFNFSAAVSAEPTGASAAMPPQRILLVEDTALVRRGLASILRRDGHVVIEAGTVAEALEMAAESVFDVFLLDLRLPDGDGVSLLTELRGKRAQRIPAILLTAATSPETADRVHNSGALLLGKPVSADDLRVRLGEVLGFHVETRSAHPDDAWSALSQEAEAEIARRGGELVEMARKRWPSEQIGHAAHRLAGLAAQFRAPEIAAVADRIEAQSRACQLDLALIDEFETLLERVAG